MSLYMCVVLNWLVSWTIGILLGRDSGEHAITRSPASLCSSRVPARRMRAPCPSLYTF